MRRLAAAFVLTAALTVPAAAEEAATGLPQPLSPYVTPQKPAPVNLTEGTDAPGERVTITLENDRFAGDRDKNYTHGTRLSWMSAPSVPPGWLNELAASLPFVGEAEAVRLMIELGQSMFTPETLAAEAPPPGERPYVGWLYVGLSALLEREDSLDRVGLLLGTLGPAAFAGSTQDSVHELFGMERPMGWDSQPDSRPGFVVLLDRFWRLVQAEPTHAIQFEMLPHAGLAAGNVFSHASAGVLFRIGSDLAREALPAAIAPGLAPGGATAADDGGFRWSLFVDFSGKAVANNATVEGLEGEGPNANPLVGDITAGLTLSWGGLSLTYARTLRSAEAEGQEGDSFGGISIGLDF